MSNKLILLDDHQKITIGIDMAELSSRIELMGIADIDEDGSFVFKTLDVGMTLDIIQKKPWKLEFDYIYQRLIVIDYLCLEPSFHELSKIKISEENFDKLLSLADYFGPHPDLLRIILDNTPSDFDWKRFGPMAKEMKKYYTKNYIATLSGNKINILDVATGTIIHESNKEDITKNIMCDISSTPLIKIISNSSVLIMVNSGQYCIYDLFNKKVIKLSNEKYNDLIISDSSKYMAGFIYGNITLIKNFSVVRSFYVPYGSSVALSNNDNVYAVLQQWSNTIHIKDIDTGKIIKNINIPHKEHTSKMLFSTNDQYLVVYLKFLSWIVIIDTSIESVVHCISVDTILVSTHKNIRFSPDSKYLAVHTGYFYVINIETGEAKKWEYVLPHYFEFIDNINLVFYGWGKARIMNIINGDISLAEHSAYDMMDAIDCRRISDKRITEAEEKYPHLFK